MHRFYKLLKLAMLGCLAVVLHNAHAGDDVTRTKQLVNQATKSIRAFIAEPSMQDFRNHLKQAKAVLIVPRSLEIGFILGASGGSGVMLTRSSGSGWKGPAFYTAGSGSLGLLAGAKVSELIVLIMNQQTLEGILEGNFKFSASAGLTVGSGASASGVSAGILSYALSKGVFGGVSLEGVVLNSKPELNRAYYGKALSAKDILIKGQLGKRRAFKLTAALQRISGQ